MWGQSYNDHIAQANLSPKLHPSQTRDLVQHLLEVRDVALALKVPFEAIAELHHNAYEAAKTHAELHAGYKRGRKRRLNEDEFRDRSSSREQ